MTRVVPITVSDHARERLRERFPGMKAARIVDEVRAALGAGRVSAEKPEGVLNPIDPGCLYCWTEDGQRIYVLIVHWDGESLAVKTTIKAAERRAR